MKQLLHTLPLIVFSFFIFSFPASAFYLQSGQDITLPESKTFAETVIIAGNNLVIDSDIVGDLICAGQNITLNGTLDGNLICAGQNLTINGPVSGNVRLAGQKLDFLKPGVVKGDLLAAGQNLSILSGIGRDILFAGENISIPSTVTIGGNLDYYVQETSAASVSAVSIKGKLTPHFLPQSTTPSTNLTSAKEALSVSSKILSLFSVLIVGLFLLLIFSFPISINKSPIKLFFLGFAVIFLTPIFIVILFMTLLGIPLAFILLLVYLIGFFVSIPLASIAIGQLIHPNRFLSLVIGSVLFTILSLLPLVGWFFGLIFLCLGFGIFSQLFISKKSL